MIVDLHAHFPMHLAATPEGSALHLMTQRDRPTLGDWLRAFTLDIASRIANYPSFTSGPAVTLSTLRAGGVGVALSVLYSPFSEMDLGKKYGSPPDASYFQALLEQIALVEQHVAQHGAGGAVVVHSSDEMDAAISTNKIALVHAVEGGFHLGGTPEEVQMSVGELARHGVAYITLAHLFWRRIATNVPALPFLADSLYKLLFPEPSIGLTELGVAAIRSMVEHRVLIDITHMSDDAMEQTFALLDALDPERSIPVIASHMACRFGRFAYNLTPKWIERIAKRNGVMGVILCDHYASDGILKHRSGNFAESMQVIYKHIDEVRAVTGCDDYAAIGTDLDGFIKPTLAGLDSASSLTRLETALREHYGLDVARQICTDNALRVLRGYWGRP